MPEPVTLDEVKRHLVIGVDATADDKLLQDDLIPAARRMVELQTRRTFGGDSPTLTGDDRYAARRAIFLIIGTWYENREGASADVKSAPVEFPLAVTWIIDSLRSWADE